MTLRVRPVIVVSVTKKPNGQLVLNYTRPELPVSEGGTHALVRILAGKPRKSAGEVVPAPAMAK